ncbi:ABC transporter substrate-binding protein [Epidermidibacterium keratini]|uniref:ABC transporter substrate-binding protein n=1 Tax=Epidermidibacterium keratini TaxID=1891644 RepID=A0A7L4YQG5_9ACTN|nr:ABC transporter substrate-binding protein [Epidermidibacterium keratini]QHC01380.1 ABC transporter substrate-binding protein [Epidermidibacterium keratini]
MARTFQPGRVRPRGVSLLVGLLALTSVSACSVGQGSAITIGKGDPIKVGVIPVVDYAPVYIAIERGYFSDEGLNVQTQVMQNAAAIAPGVINGQLQFGTAATTAFIAPAAKGLPLVAVADQADVAVDEAADPAAVLVGADSAITRPKELEGKTVATNALGSIAYVSMAALVKGDGGDPSKVSWVAMPFPDMVGALAEGRIDAAFANEPFTTLHQQAGAVVLSPGLFPVFTPGESYALVFSAKPFVEKNPEIVEAFVSALAKASELARTDPQVVVDVLVKYGGMKPEVAAAMKQPTFGDNVDPAALTQASEVMADLGMLPGPVDGTTLVMDGGETP